jgi:hypothetical protein
MAQRGSSRHKAPLSFSLVGVIFPSRKGAVKGGLQHPLNVQYLRSEDRLSMLVSGSEAVVQCLGAQPGILLSSSSVDCSFVQRVLSGGLCAVCAVCFCEVGIACKPLRKIDQVATLKRGP